MTLKTVNGYVVEISPVPSKENTLFVTFKDKSETHHCFSLIKADGAWGIRNPLTVPALMLEIGEELIKDL